MEKSLSSQDSGSEVNNDCLSPRDLEEDINSNQDHLEPMHSIDIQTDLCSDDVWWTNDDSVWYDAMEDLSALDDEDETDPQEERKKVTGDEPIYPGSSLSVCESALLILTFALRHNLNGECLSDLLTLISLHCLATNILHQSLFKFKSFFSNLKSPLVIHIYCRTCDLLLKSSDNTCFVCKKSLNEKGNTSYFGEIPLLYQLQQFFKRPAFHEQLLHRFKRNNDGICDTYDGELYKQHSRQGKEES